MGFTPFFPIIVAIMSHPLFLEDILNIILEYKKIEELKKVKVYIVSELYAFFVTTREL